MSIWWLGYPLLGAFAGLAAGLFGVGGGLTIVPLLLMLFTAQDFPVQHAMHLALGTSMTTIVFTSISSMRAHHQHGAVRWDIVRIFAPGLMAGTFGGSFIAAVIPTRPLAMVFTAIVFYASASMLIAWVACCCEIASRSAALSELSVAAAAEAREQTHATP